MPDDKRQDERIPVGLRVRLRYADVQSFAAGYAANLSRNGVFLEGVPARAPDTIVRFELLLTDGTPALRGEGRVIWSRATGAKVGIALRFTKLDGRSKALLDEMTKGNHLAPGSIPPPPPTQSLKFSPPPPLPQASRASPPHPPPAVHVPMPSPPPAQAASRFDRPSVRERMPANSVAPREPRAVDGLIQDLELLAEPLLYKLVARGASAVERRSVAQLDADLAVLIAETPAVPSSPQHDGSHGHAVVSGASQAPQAAHGRNGASRRNAGRATGGAEQAAFTTGARALHEAPVALPELELAEMSEPGGERIALRSTPPDATAINTSPRARGDR